MKLTKHIVILLLMKLGFHYTINAHHHNVHLLYNIMWAKMDSNHRRRKPADLQSAPFGHSGIRPSTFVWDYKGSYIFFTVQVKSIIFMAASAASEPLLPRMPPARSMASCSVSTVSTPNMTGQRPCALSAVMPCVTL